MSKKTARPNLAIEAFLSTIRWIIVILVLNNGLWLAAQISSSKSHSSNGIQIKMTQDGRGNHNSQNFDGNHA